MSSSPIGSSDKFAVAVLTLCAGTVLLPWLYNALKRTGDAQTWASWVQAIGSVVAILVSVWVTSRLHRLEVLEAQKERTRLEQEQLRLHHRTRSLSLFQWSQSLHQAAQACQGLLDNIGRQRATWADFRLLRALLESTSRRMQQRDLDVLVDFDEMNNIVQGISEIDAMTAALDVAVELGADLARQRARGGTDAASPPDLFGIALQRDCSDFMRAAEAAIPRMQQLAQYIEMAPVDVSWLATEPSSSPGS